MRRERSAAPVVSVTHAATRAAAASGPGSSPCSLPCSGSSVLTIYLIFTINILLSLLSNEIMTQCIEQSKKQS